MLKSTDQLLAASSGSVLAAEGFKIPVSLHSFAKSPLAALDILRQGFEELREFVQKLQTEAPGIELVLCHESANARRYRVDFSAHGKEYRHDLALSIRAPLPKDDDFWARLRMVTVAYERLFELVAKFDERKSIQLELERARLSGPKVEAEGNPNED